MRFKDLAAKACLATLCALPVAHAAQPSVPLHCEVTLTPLQQRVVDAVAYYLPKPYVTHNSVTNTYSIETAPLQGYSWTNWDTGLPQITHICPSSQFYGDTSIGQTTWMGRGRSAVLVGHNTFLSSPHTTMFDHDSFYVVFLPSGFPCTLSNLDSIPADNVYDPIDFNFNNIYASYAGHDVMTFTVDRSVVGRKPLKIRRSGSPGIGDPVMHAGHSFWSGARVSLHGTHHGDRPVHYNGGSLVVQVPHVTEIYPYDGASGSPIFNMKDEVIETVVRSNVNGHLVAGPATGSDCLIEDEVHASPQPTNGRLIDVQALIPRQEVLVTPLDAVKHVAPIGGTLAQPVTTYELRGGLSSNQYAVDPPSGFSSSTSPTLTSSIPPGDRFLSLVTPTPWTLTAGISNVLTCGIWDYTFNVRDRYNLQNNYARHRFEIGVEEYTLSPDVGTTIHDFGWPVTKTFPHTLTNVRPSPVSLQLSTAAPNGSPSAWLRVNGATSTTVTLAPAGQPGDSVTVVVSVVTPNRNDRLDPQQLHIDHVNPACALAGPSRKSVTYAITIGKDIFTQIASGDFLDQPSVSGAYGIPEVMTLDVTDGAGYCVSDVNLKAGIMRSMGINLDFPWAAEHIRIRLKSPSGTHLTLWDKNPLPSAAYVEDTSIYAFDYLWAAQNLKLDDQSTPPPLALLSGFNGEPVQGTWELDMSMATVSTTVMPLQTMLEISVAPCVP